MMYTNKLVAAIKASGKVLREFKDTVKVPFGTEYSIYLKNLNSIRALMRISIDGKDAFDGSQFVLDANSEINIERFIKDGNLDLGNKFKFIERNSKVEQARGVQAEDGLVRIEWQYEKVQPVVTPNPWCYGGIWYNNQYPQIGNPPYPSYGQPTFYSTTICNNSANNVYYGSTEAGSCTTDYCASEPVAMASAPTTMSTTSTTSSFGSTNAVHAKGMLRSSIKSTGPQTIPQNDAGITAPGSVSEQKFMAASLFPVETETHVIILKLVGETETGVVTKPITVKSKARCVTCARLNISTASFCMDCGTGLNIV